MPDTDDVEPIPSMSSGAVGSRFVSEKDVQAANETRDKQWKEAYARCACFAWYLYVRD